MDEMDGLKRQALVSYLVRKMADEGSWCGETHIQKSVFFLQGMLRVPTGYGYILYKHGPYSFDLHDELTAMRANLVLDLQSQAPFGPSFRLGPAAEMLQTIFPKTRSRYERQLDFVARALSKNNVAALERLGTALYVYLEDPTARTNDLARQVVGLKPHVTYEAALESVGEVASLHRRAREDDLIVSA